eukprot:CAMPEP_0182529574 /NCGR_PEP_ID=MMETSP1323-20130603/5288_1 /TAXON_ID=236787 /ORGANISM="Florenciella parvula, Strain RCC1693" /LENGTH=31 /DNA_ID= /DNA_START= /DNA_END= /DNA_ORIENTATION=
MNEPERVASNEPDPSPSMLLAEEPNEVDPPP